MAYCRLSGWQFDLRADGCFSFLRHDKEMGVSGNLRHSSTVPTLCLLFRVILALQEYAGTSCSVVSKLNLR